MPRQVFFNFFQCKHSAPLYLLSCSCNVFAQFFRSVHCIILKSFFDFFPFFYSQNYHWLFANFRLLRPKERNFIGDRCIRSGRRTYRQGRGKRKLSLLLRLDSAFDCLHNRARRRQICPEYNLISPDAHGPLRLPKKILEPINGNLSVLTNIN